MKYYVHKYQGDKCKECGIIFKRERCFGVSGSICALSGLCMVQEPQQLIHSGDLRNGPHIRWELGCIISLDPPMKAENRTALLQRVFWRSEALSSDNYRRCTEGGGPQEPLTATRTCAAGREL